MEACRPPPLACGSLVPPNVRLRRTGGQIPNISSPVLRSRTSGGGGSLDSVGADGGGGTHHEYLP